MNNLKYVYKSICTCCGRKDYCVEYNDGEYDPCFCENCLREAIRNIEEKEGEEIDR